MTFEYQMKVALSIAIDSVAMIHANYFRCLNEEQ